MKKEKLIHNSEKRHKTLFLYLAALFLFGSTCFLYFVFKSGRPQIIDRIPQKNTQINFSYFHDINNAHSFYHSQQYRLAAKILSDLLTTDLSDRQQFTVQVFLACCYKEIGLYSSALEYIRKAQKKENTAFPLYLEASIHLTAGKPDAAETALLKCLSADRNYLPALEKLGDMAFIRKDFLTALKFYSGNGYKDNNSKILLKAALCNYLSGDINEASSLSHAYSGNNKNPEYSAYTWFIRALSSQNDTTREENFSIAAAQADFNEKNIFRYFAALQNIRMKKYETAVETLRPLSFNQTAELPGADFALGQLFFKTKDYAQSLRHLDANYRLNKGEEDNYYYGACLYRMRQYEKAAAILNRTVAEASSREYGISAAVLYINAQTRLGKTALTTSMIHSAIDRWGASAELIYALAWHTIQSNPDDFFSETLPYRSNPEYPRLYLYEAKYHLLKNNPGRALILIIDYLQKNPFVPELAKLCGDLYLKLEDYPNAVFSYRSALAGAESSGDTQLCRDIVINMCCAYAFTKGAGFAEEFMREKLNTAELSDAPALYNLALLNRIAQRDSRYDELLAKAISTSETSARDLKALIYLEYGLYLRSAGKRHAAQQYLKKAYDFAPESTITEYHYRKSLQ